MCGITACAGSSPALPFLLQGLEKLEYRGYDSAGITLLGESGLVTVKTKGRLSALEEAVAGRILEQPAGIGHTRWATHGIPSNLNSHPHENGDSTLAIVHNGIIENYTAIKEFLQDEGYQFQSETDSEVIVHMLDYYYDGDLFAAMLKTVRYLQGSFALCAVAVNEPDTVITARKDSPMILGQGQGASYCASDIPALLEYTRTIHPMEDEEVAILKPEGIRLFDFAGNEKEIPWTTVQFDIQAAQKGGYDTFMEKEIREQPHVIEETLRGRLGQDTILFPELEAVDMETVDQVYFIGCGTAYHACLYAQALFRKWSTIPSQCIPASEFRYGSYLVNDRTLCLFVSQSGETADTLAAFKLAKEKGALCISLTNVLGSSLARQTDISLYTCAGPEIAVASTKAYTTQLVMLVAIVACLTGHADKELLDDFVRLPELCEAVMDLEPVMADCAALLKDQRDAYFIGRQMDYFSVLEGALKLKEVSYIHADAYYAGELKHGPIALIEDGTFVVAVAVDPHVAGKTISNIQETMARGARIVLITNETQQADMFERVLRIPDVHPALSGIPVAVLLQLLALYAAKEKGCDVDKPRNLAKSVTVE